MSWWSFPTILGCQYYESKVYLLLFLFLSQRLSYLSRLDTWTRNVFFKDRLCTDSWKGQFRGIFTVLLGSDESLLFLYNFIISFYWNCDRRNWVLLRCLQDSYLYLSAMSNATTLTDCQPNLMFSWARAGLRMSDAKIRLVFAQLFSIRKILSNCSIALIFLVCCKLL